MEKKFLVVGDVHGRIDLLRRLLEQYSIDEYFFLFCGDLNDYGDEYREISSSLKCIDLVMGMVESDDGACTDSNHQDKLRRFLGGSNVQPSHGLANTIAELEKRSDEYKNELFNWLSERPLFYPFEEDGKKYVAVHAYFDDYMLDKAYDPFYQASKKKRDAFRSFCIYGKTDEEGRIKFWEGDWIDKNMTQFHLISGHYHETHNRKNFTMIDSGERAIVYYVPSENYVGVVK